MYKKLFIFLLVFVCAFVGLLFLTPAQPKPLPIQKLIPNRTLTATEVLAQYNESRSKVKNFTCILELWVKGIKLDGSIFYEKPKKFRMFTTSFVGLESDIGANETYFWFWSRRYYPLNLYMARHEDLGDTYLRTPFNPYLIKELLGIDPIDVKDGKIYRHEKNYVIIQDGTSLQGKPIIKSYVYDPELETIVAFYIYDKKYQPVLSLEVETQKCNNLNIPKKIMLCWHEENASTTWIFKNVKLDSDIEANTWSIPKGYNIIDLKGYLPKASLIFLE